MAIDFNYENKLREKYGYPPASASPRDGVRDLCIAGLDEVGRGPLAGPVTVGAFVFLNNPKGGFDHPLGLLRDSKLLSAKQREKLYEYFCELKKGGKVDFATASVFPRTIDKKHIHHATALAMQRAVQKLDKKPDYALIDGFRYPGKILKEVEYSTMPKADNLIPSVAAASIVAKVKRDASMVRYHKKYPQYRFDLHKGYGTELHYKMLKKHGPSHIHRQSFRLY
ncbi:MAG: ribonuclease HII [Candidatus Spechtbacterales bacterium]